MRALTVTRVFLGAKKLRRCFASLPRARDALARVRKLCSGRSVRVPRSQVVVCFLSVARSGCRVR